MEKLLKILHTIRPDVDFVNEKQLIDNGVLDSFDIISIVAALDEEYGIEIDAEELEPDNFNSVEAILELVEKMR